MVNALANTCPAVTVRVGIITARVLTNNEAARVPVDEVVEAGAVVRRRPGSGQRQRLRRKHRS